MGCDIHMYGEIRGADGTWNAIHVDPDINLDIRSYAGPDDADYGLQQFYDGRWYELFGALSDGVRRYRGEPARGMPSDVSAPLRAIDDDYYHSHSWLSLMDLYRLCAVDAFDRGSVGSAIREITENLEKFKPTDVSVEDIRVVFWFDN